MSNGGREDDMRIGALASWFGSNRMLGPKVGEALRGCNWVGVVFAGGFAEVPHIKASTLVCNDKHKAIMNMAHVCADERLGPKLYRKLRRMEFSQERLDDARDVCGLWEKGLAVSDDARLSWAEAYFIACWMNRSAKAGTDTEFDGGLPIRWSGGGGDSALRFHNAVLGLPAWRRTLRRCSFYCEDFREFLLKCKDVEGNGIYADPPFFDVGSQYRHKFRDEDHVALYRALCRFSKAKVVIRYYDHPMMRELYGATPALWRFNPLEGGRTQANKTAPEVLITNFPMEKAA